MTEGEHIIDEVTKHWVTYVGPTLICVAGVALLFVLPTPPALWWFTSVAGMAVAGYGLWRAHRLHMDRFVITTMRVFRVYGVVDRHIATMPLSRILDVSVYQPMAGMVLDYGHFVFESAAQDQGLRDIRFVADPTRRDLTIQEVIQHAGIRAYVKPQDPDDDGT